MFMSMICKLERVVEEIREAVKEVREHHGKPHRQYMLSPDIERPVLWDFLYPCE